MSAPTAVAMLSPILARLLAQARADDLRRAAARPPRIERPVPGARPAVPQAAVTLRFGFPDDAVALERLAALDSAQPPAAPVLLAEVAGELRAALSLSEGTVVADPLHPTAALVELLQARARQLDEPGHRGWAARRRRRARSLARRSARRSAAA